MTIFHFPHYVENFLIPKIMGRLWFSSKIIKDLVIKYVEFLRFVLHGQLERVLIHMCMDSLMLNYNNTSHEVISISYPSAFFDIHVTTTFQRFSKQLTSRWGTQTETFKHFGKTSLLWPETCLSSSIWKPKNIQLRLHLTSIENSKSCRYIWIWVPSSKSCIA